MSFGVYAGAVHMHILHYFAFAGFLLIQTIDCRELYTYTNLFVFSIFLLMYSLLCLTCSIFVWYKGHTHTQKKKEKRLIPATNHDDCYSFFHLNRMRFYCILL